MVRVPIPWFSIVVLVATCTGCASWKYPDEPPKRETVPEPTPPTGNPLVMPALEGLSHWVNYGDHMSSP